MCALLKGVKIKGTLITARAQIHTQMHEKHHIHTYTRDISLFYGNSRKIRSDKARNPSETDTHVDFWD